MTVERKDASTRRPSGVPVMSPERAAPAAGGAAGVEPAASRARQTQG